MSCTSPLSTQSLHICCMPELPRETSGLRYFQGFWTVLNFFSSTTGPSSPPFFSQFYRRADHTTPNLFIKYGSFTFLQHSRAKHAWITRFGTPKWSTFHWAQNLISTSQPDRANSKAFYSLFYIVSNRILHNNLVFLDMIYQLVKRTLVPKHFGSAAAGLQS